MSAMTTAAAIDLVITLIQQAARVSSRIQAANAEGRESLTSAEVDEIEAENDLARGKLSDAIKRARDEGR